MKPIKASRWLLIASTILLLALPAFAQEDRGKAELVAGAGKIIIDYGKPQLKGRDPLTWQKDGAYWRMGSNATTTFTTPVDLSFGNTKVPKGKYSLWLLKVSADTYELVFNSLIESMGMNHDKTKDVASAPLKVEKLANSVENFQIELKEAPQGGAFSMSWGTSKLSASFQIHK
jgi:hypothetical protein